MTYLATFKLMMRLLFLYSQQTWLKVRSLLNYRILFSLRPLSHLLLVFTFLNNSIFFILSSYIVFRPPIVFIFLVFSPDSFHKLILQCWKKTVYLAPYVNGNICIFYYEMFAQDYMECNLFYITAKRVHCDEELQGDQTLNDHSHSQYFCSEQM